MAEIFAIISACMMVLAGPPYLVSILAHKTKPERASWFIWSTLSGIAFVTQIGLHAHWSLVYAAVNALGNILVFLLSLHYGVGGWKGIDIAAFFVAAFGVVASLISKDPFYALLGVIAANFAATVPTLYKTYKAPSTEYSLAWFFIGTSALFGVFSVGLLDYKLLLLPTYMVCATYGVLVAQVLGRAHFYRTRSRKKSKRQYA